MNFNRYVANLQHGEKLTLRYSLNGKEKSFGTYVTTKEHTIHPIDGKRTVRDFDKCRVKEVYVEGNKTIVMLAANKDFLRKHQKYNTRMKSPTEKSMKELTGMSIPFTRRSIK